MKATSPLEIYPYLPENCEDLFNQSRMSLALRLINRNISLKSIKSQLLLSDSTGSSYKALEQLLSPAIREVTIGVGENAVTVGGDDVLFRHNMTFYNRTPIAAGISDTWTENEIEERIKEITSFKKFYIGKILKIQMIAIFCDSNDPEIYTKTVEKVSLLSSLPLVLCSKNSEAIKNAVLITKNKKPLIYGADSENWREMAQIALEFKLPLAICGNGDLNLLQSIAFTLEYNGVSEIVVDPGFDSTARGFKKTFQNFVSLRISGISADTSINYPTLFFADGFEQNQNERMLFSSIPDSLLPENKHIRESFFETVCASVMTVRYCDILILKHFYPHEILPLIHLIDTMYTDPRVPVSVSPGLYKIGEPDDESPVLFTTNFALTFHTVESDLSSQNIDCYLIAVNTKGLGVEAAVAGGQLTGEIVKKQFDEAGFDISETKHNTIIIPGLAARLQGEIEKIMDAKILVGPMDSGKLAQWIEENFYKKE